MRNNFLSVNELKIFLKELNIDIQKNMIKILFIEILNWIIYY